MATSTERMRRLRERRTAALGPVDGPVPLGESDRLLPAVEESLAALQLGGRDSAVAALARRYAAAIDEAENQALALIRLGPGFLRVLQALHAAPASRPPARKAAGRGPNRVQELRLASARMDAKRRRGRGA